MQLCCLPDLTYYCCLPTLCATEECQRALQCLLCSVTSHSQQKHRGHTECPTLGRMMEFLSCFNHPLTAWRTSVHTVSATVSQMENTVSAIILWEGSEEGTQGGLNAHPTLTCPAGTSRSLSLTQHLKPMPALHEETQRPEPCPARAVSAPAWLRHHEHSNHHTPLPFLHTVWTS